MHTTWARHVTVGSRRNLNQTVEVVKVDMKNRDMNDAKMSSWCSWFIGHFPFVRRSLSGNGPVCLVVDFSNNALTEVGVEALLRTLEEHILAHTPVEVLQLYKNNVSGRGAAIMQFIDSAEGKLRELGLSHNRLGTDAVHDIISAVVGMRTAGGYAYPRMGQIPMWLRIEENPYESAELEAQLRAGFSRLQPARPLDSTICVQVYGGYRHTGCTPYVCKAIKPAPAIQAGYLFRHRAAQVPSTLRESTYNDEADWAPFIIPTSQSSPGHFNIKMQGFGITDEVMRRWCAWFVQYQRELAESSTKIVLHEVNFSNNKLTPQGVVQLIQCLIRCKLKPAIVWYTNEHAHDVSYTFVAEGASHEKFPCPLRTRGCICGRNCHEHVSQQVLEEHWAERVSEREIRMSNEGLDDATIALWCYWFETSYLAEVIRPGHSCETRFDSVDFSCNQLSADGVQTLLATFRKLSVYAKAIDLYKNQIEGDEGGEITVYLQWSMGELQSLGLTQNKLGTDAILDIILAAVDLRSNDENCYPLGRSRPLWLRVEQNSYDSIQLEQKLRTSFAASGRELEKTICVVTHTHECWRARRGGTCVQVHPPPQIHATYLFGHWARCAPAASDACASISQTTLPSFQARGHDLMKALHKLRSVTSEFCPQAQSHGRPLEKPRSVPKPAPDTSKCTGILRPQVDSEFGRVMRFIVTMPKAWGLPQCFLPQTEFRDETGTYISAGRLSELCTDVRPLPTLLGPNGTSVKVLYAKKHPDANQVVARIRAGRVVLLVTHDHPLPIVKGAVQQRMDARMVAREYAKGECLSISDGKHLHVITEASINKEQTSVVEIGFENDAMALVWIRSRRRRSESARIAVYGSPPSQQDLIRSHGYTVARTFIDVMQSQSSGRRSRSLGHSSDPSSGWSRGSRGHPDTCKACKFHLRYLRGWQNGQIRCGLGAHCGDCHDRSHLVR